MDLPIYVTVEEVQRVCKGLNIRDWTKITDGKVTDNEASVILKEVNAEEMIDLKTGTVKTSHTVNPVDVIYLARDARDWTMAPGGKLSDIAPTVLKLLNLPIPEEMTAQCLLSRIHS